MQTVFIFSPLFSSVCVCIIKYNSESAKGLYISAALTLCVQQQDGQYCSSSRCVCVCERETEREGEFAARCLCTYLIRFRPQSEVSFSHLLQLGRVCVQSDCLCFYCGVRVCEDMSRSVFPCLCSPILSLTLCDNRFYHTLHFCVCVYMNANVLACLCSSISVQYSHIQGVCTEMEQR